LQTDIQSQTAEELEAAFKQWNEPRYRVSQLLQWLHVKRASAWDEMTNLPRTLRDRLQLEYAFHPLELVQKQGAVETTQKFLWKLADGAMIESVLIPANPALYGEPSDRHTLCVSTQVGCAYGCQFCASGLNGLKRNLEAGEIVGQFLAVERLHGQSPLGKREPGTRLVSNLVIMGMGEPLANFENLIRALHILNAPWGGGIGARKITVSTSGLVPQIRRLADEPAQYRLAISLHGATDEIRSRIMPVNKKYPLAELAAACEYYQEKKGKVLTFEYILIAGVNDQPEQAALLATLARRLNAKVNLIPYNHVEGLPWERPDAATQEAFLKALEKRKITATLRREKGHEIDAACGQLRLRTERALAGQGGADRES